MCQEYGIGEADDNFVDGLLKIAKNYESYVQNVIDYVKHLSVEENNRKLAETLKHSIDFKLSTKVKKRTE